MEKISQVPIWIVITILIGLSISLSGCTTSNNDNSTIPTNSDNAENFTFTHLDGSTGELKDYRGKIVILDMWATWCSPCQYQMLELIKAYNDYSREDLEILSINIDPDETNNDIETFIEEFLKYGYELNWVFGNEIDDLSKYKKEPDSGIPSICFFNRNGEVVYKHVGLMLYGDTTLLKEKIDEFISS